MTDGDIFINLEPTATTRNEHEFSLRSAACGGLEPGRKGCPLLGAKEKCQKLEGESDI
jgi:hypothetical protein